MQISELTTETSTTITEASIESPNSELFDAVKEGNLDRVKELIERGASINTKGSDGNTPLHLAAKVGNLSIVTYLVGKRNADLYVKNKYGQTPIYLAAKNNHLDTVKYLEGIVPVLEGIDAIVGIAGGVVDILQKFGVLPSEESKDFQKVFDALGKNYAAIEEVGNKVDRNFAEMKEVYYMVSRTLLAIEGTRLEMRQGFQRVLDSIRELGTIDKVSDIITFIDDFTESVKFIEGLHSKERVDELERNDNILDTLNKDITLDGKLRGNLKNIIHYHAFPQNAEDSTGFAAFHVLYYGTQICVSAAFFVLEQYSYLADYYYNKGEIDRYNKNCSLLQLRFKNFKGLLFGQDGIIDKVIDILVRVQQDPDFVFVRNAREDVFKLLPERITSLEQIKDKLQNMELPITENQPKKRTGVPDFSKSNVTTPIGQWKEGIKVSYAIQYRENSTYSQIGEWSDPVAIHKKANPFLIIPGAGKEGRERLIFRKFNNGESPELVGVIKGKDEISFRDISRDVYDAALSSDEDSARGEIKVLLCNGADINETFDYGRKAIHAAAQSNNFNITLDLLSLNGTNINVQDADGYTPIYIAAEAGYVDFVKSLIDHGADPNIKTNKSNLTPLHIAAYQGYFPVVETLMLSNKADINAKDKDDFTPLHSATFSDSSPTIRVLLNSNNTDVNANSKEGLTPLHLAAIKNHGDATKILLESNRADVNAEAKGNLTALHFAASIGNLEVAKVLIEYNETNVNAKSADNLTPLHFATFLKKEDVALELLKAQGIDVNSKGKGGTIPLHIAAITGQNNVTSSLLQKGALTEETIKGNLTALHIAAMHDKDKIISTLIDEGHAKMEAKTVNGSTPLHLASFAGASNSTLLTLLKRGADTRLYDNNGYIPVHVAILNGKNETVNILVEYEDDLVNVADKNGEFPLHLAAKTGYVDIISCLLNNKADLNARDNYDLTPLHWAAQYNNTKAIERLAAEKGTDLDIRNNDGRAPLHLAAQYNSSDAINCLAALGANLNIQDNSGWTPLHLAVKGKNLGAVKSFVAEEKADLNIRDNDGFTPLHWAAKDNYLSAIKYLAEKGVKLDIRANDGRTPLHLAVIGNLFYVIKYLAALGADLNIQDNSGWTCLHLAVQGGNLDAVKFLAAEKMINLNIRGENGMAPLHLATQGGNLDIVKPLVENGADVNARDNSPWYGGIPLNYAAISGHLDIIVYLVEKRAKVNAKDISNTTPLHCAAASTQSSLPIVKCLVEHGANVNARGMDNKTPIWGGGAGANLDVIKYLVEHGAYTRIPSDQGYTLEEYIAREVLPRIYDEAVRKSYYEILDYLRLHRVSGIENSEADCNKGNGSQVKSDASMLSSWVSDLARWVKGLLFDGSAANRQEPVLFYVHNNNTNSSARVISTIQNQTKNQNSSYHLSYKPLPIGSNNQPEIAASSGTRPSSWTNGLFGWVKSSIGELSSSKSEETSSTPSPILQVDAPTDVNGTIMLLDVLVRNVTGQKYISSVENSISLLEVQSYALNVTEGFEKVVRQAAKDSKISMHQLNIDFVEIQKEVTGKVMGSKFNEIPGILKSHIEKACLGRGAGKLSSKKFDKFIAQFNKGLDVVLNQSIQQILHNGDGTLEVGGAKKQQMSLEPQSYLSNASIQSHLTQDKAKIV
ncbi:ankyrin repeat domain-containing protein [Wolbachia endosymbiont (group B) of Villa cingulata]|uniref:ankyrin repeat domain-containing protein n=1 Tax=Wolbachia endosymbiont (group B) of Villa cingulata TaxID=3066157 RepID=UPI00333E5206